jgi:hypothetical protein
MTPNCHFKGSQDHGSTVGSADVHYDGYFIKEFTKLFLIGL